MPDLVPAKMIKGDTQKNWIMYEKQNGKRFVNSPTRNDGSLTEFPTPEGEDRIFIYSSEEIKNGFDLLGEEKLEMVRDELGARIGE